MTSGALMREGLLLPEDAARLKRDAAHAEIGFWRFSESRAFVANRCHGPMGMRCVEMTSSPTTAKGAIDARRRILVGVRQMSWIAWFASIAAS